MPVMSGLEASQQITQSFMLEDRRPYIVALTASFIWDIQLCLAACKQC